MGWYTVRVSDAQGRVRELSREANGEDALLRDLSREGHYPISIREQAASDRRSARRYGPRVVVEFTEVLAELLGARLSLKDALDVAAHALERRPAGRLTRDLSATIRKGTSLSAALAEYERSFPRLYVGLVRVGERTGTLNVVIPQLATYLKARRALNDKVAAAAMYPLVVVAVGILAMIVVSVVVIPSVREMTGQIGTAAPAELELALERIGRMSVVFWIVAGTLAGAAVIVALLRRGEESGVAVDRALLSLPAVGGYLRQSQIAQLMFGMEALTGSGIAVEDAIEQVRAVVSNKAIARDLDRIHERLNQGTRLSEALAEAQTIPARVTAWSRIGEHTGNIAGVFSQMRAYYDKEIERMAGRLTALVEPALIIAVGGAILFVVIRVVVPLFGAMRSIV
ncbi:MAG: type II secretion system F family protein [Spirochaetota bacterium]